MLDLKFIRQNKELIQKAIEQKNVTLNLQKLLEWDQKVLEAKKELQALEQERNANAKKIPTLSVEERVEKIEYGKQLGQHIQQKKSTLEKLETELNELLLCVPQIPALEAPVGPNDQSNVVIRSWGEKPHFHFEPQDHLKILLQNRWAEFEQTARISGTRSFSLMNEMVLLERALLQFALELLVQKGFRLISVPSAARDFAFLGTGHFPLGRDQAYALEGENLYLTGTSEVFINSLHANQILSESQLPILYGGFSTCFRSEAGASGKDTRGLIRVHQFSKVEQFVICKADPAESAHWQTVLMDTAEHLLKQLEIPFQVVDVSTGDMGLGKVRQFDIEAWVPSEQKYRETHSCSMFYDWQARRASVRYRDSLEKVQFCHTLNNTACATPRILVPFLENHQQSDGSIFIPLPLRKFIPVEYLKSTNAS